MHDENAVKELLVSAIRAANADEIEISVRAGRRGDLRFGCSTAANSAQSDFADIRVSAAYGRQQATVQSTGLSAESLREAIERAENVARIVRENPEYQPRLSSRNYAHVESWDPAAAAIGPQERATIAAQTLREASSAKLSSSGFLENVDGIEAVANSAGLFAYQKLTRVSYSVTLRTSQGASGWAGAQSFQASGVDGAGVTREAMRKALKAGEPVELEPGVYPTIFEPSVTADFLALLVSFMDRRAADEGRSYFGFPGHRIGDRPFSEKVTIMSDPAHPLLPTRKWGEDGLALARTTWVSAGRIENLRTSRYWSREKGVPAVAGPEAVVMNGGAGTVDDLAAQTDYGLLLGGLFYIRTVDPQTLVFTGLTRDGLFLIENGVVTRPVVNFRWNESPAAILAAVDLIGAPVLAIGKDTDFPAIAPPLRTREFHYASIAPSS